MHTLYIMRIRSVVTSNLCKLLDVISNKLNKHLPAHINHNAFRTGY